MMEFLEVHKFDILLLFFVVLGTVTTILYAQLVLMRVQARETKKHLNYMARQYEELTKSLLKKVDAQTTDGLSYEFICEVLGDLEAANYQREAMRLTQKLGLRPGYYRSNVDNTFCRITHVFDSPESDTIKKARQSISSFKRFRVLRRDGFECQLCGFKAGDETGVGLHLDHKMPRSKGGSDEEDNLWTLCDKCNMGKSDLVMPELFSNVTE